MGQGEYSTKRDGWKQLDYEARLKIEALSKAGIKKTAIGKQLGYSERTIRREMKRGITQQVDTEYRFYEIYSADIGQDKHNTMATAKGCQVKLGNDYVFAGTVSALIKAGRSPYGALEIMRQKGGYKTDVCFKTLYNYIEKGYIPGVTQKDLPERGRGRKRGYRPVRAALNNTKGRSISERGEETNGRKSFGHWEFDTVVGRKGTRAALLVLSERLTRQEKILPMKEKTQEEVKRLLNGIEREYGTKRFKAVFKTITADNGSEFLGTEAIEKSVNGKGKRTTVYYCHPYSAWERGTNENINKMIRRFIPKGKDIGNYTAEEIQTIEDFINSTPRKVLEGYPSNTLYQQYTASLKQPVRPRTI